MGEQEGAPDDLGRGITGRRLRHWVPGPGDRDLRLHDSNACRPRAHSPKGYYGRTGWHAILHRDAYDDRRCWRTGHQCDRRGCGGCFPLPCRRTARGRRRWKSARQHQVAYGARSQNGAIGGRQRDSRGAGRNSCGRFNHYGSPWRPDLRRWCHHCR